MNKFYAIWKGLAKDLVHVNSYLRVRFGKLEHVCEHYRNWPGTASVVTARRNRP